MYLISLEISHTIADDPILLGLKRAALKQQQKSKKRKGVDPRASKGRKLKFHVQEKIQNYMAPEPRGTWHSEMSEELFAALLGQQTIASSSATDVPEAAIQLQFEDGFKILS